MIKIGIIREGKIPADSRVPVTPELAYKMEKEGKVKFIVQKSNIRCFEDGSYEDYDIELRDLVEDADYLIGVKEVKIKDLIPNKTYFFFSHTTKKQTYNRSLLQAILKKNITLIDWETITNEKGSRVIAFGYYAGMVGAHNALMTYGVRTKKFSIGRLNQMPDYLMATKLYKQVNFPPVKIVLTGTGRVGQGAKRVLLDMGIVEVVPQEFLTEDYSFPVFTQLACKDYVKPKNGDTYTTSEYYNFPERFESSFAEYTKVSDIFINGIYWDNKAPKFFSKEDMKATNFKIKTIADITCDIAPISSVPSTLRPSTIADPIFGYNPMNGKEEAAFKENVIDIMSIDNLPNEIPKDASTGFAEMFYKDVYPELIKEKSERLDRATITRNGKLTDKFAYLQDFVDGKED